MVPTINNNNQSCLRRIDKMANYNTLKQYIIIMDKNTLVKIKQPKIQELDSLFNIILNNLTHTSTLRYL